MSPGEEHRFCGRTHLTRPVQIEYHLHRIPVHDLSLTGAFIEDELPVHIGQAVPLTLWLTDIDSIEVEAEIRRIEGKKGFGVEFVTINPGEKARLQAFLQAARKHAA